MNIVLTKRLDLIIHNILSFVIVLYDWYNSTSFAVVAVVALFTVTSTNSQQASAVVVVYRKSLESLTQSRIERTNRNIPDAK